MTNEKIFEVDAPILKRCIIKKPIPMFGQLLTYTGLCPTAIALDALEASLVYLFSIIFLLWGVFGLASHESPFWVESAESKLANGDCGDNKDSTGCAGLIRLHYYGLDDYFQYFCYIISGNAAALLFIALSYSVGATTAALELQPDPIPVAAPAPQNIKRSRASIQAQVR